MTFLKTETIKHTASADDTCFLIASGPSVMTFDLNRLADKYIMMVNGALMAREHFDIYPSVWGTTDLRFFRSSVFKSNLFQSYIDQPKFNILCSGNIRSFTPDILSANANFIPVLGKDGFSRDIDFGFYFWSTSISLLIQHAFSVGKKNVVLIGVDLTYDLDRPRFYKEDKPEMSESFRNVQIFNIKNARQHFLRVGGDIFTCSKGTPLNLYIPHIDFEEAVQMAGGSRAHRLKQINI